MEQNGLAARILERCIMLDINSVRIARLERRNRLLTPWSLVVTALALAMPLTDSFGLRVAAQDKPKALSVSELAVVDERGTLRVRIGGQLPDAVLNGKILPRGQKAAGVLLYDETGQERSGYVTFAPSGNVGLTLDNRDGQTAEFIAGPNGAPGCVSIGKLTQLICVQMRMEQAYMPCRIRRLRSTSLQFRTRSPRNCAKLLDKPSLSFRLSNYWTPVMPGVLRLPARFALKNDVTSEDGRPNFLCSTPYQ